MVTTPDARARAVLEKLGTDLIALAHAERFDQREVVATLDRATAAMRRAGMREVAK